MTYWLHVSVIGLYYAMLATSWNLLAGYTGQVSFAHAAFAGIGAYVSGLLALHVGAGPWLGIAAGSAAAALAGLGLGALCLRMGGIYLSLATLGFSELLRLVLVNEERVTRGTMGLQVPGLFGESPKAACLALFLAAAAAMLWLVRSLALSARGIAFRAVLDDEQAARACGIDTRRVRLEAFVLSSAMAGLAGALYGHYLMLITPDIASLDQMFLVLAMTVVGGLGGLTGPAAAAVLLEFMSEQIRAFGSYHLLVFGVATLLIYRFAPEGLGGLARRRTR